MKNFNINDLMKEWGFDGQWEITIVDLNYNPVIKEEPKHVTDNFNEQYPAGQ